jgi:hypothetical protein
VTGLWAEHLRNQGLIPSRDSAFVFLIAPDQFLSNGFWGSFPRDKDVEHDHSPPPSKSLRMDEAIPPHLHVSSWTGAFIKFRGNFTFTFYFFTFKIII